MKLIVGLGNPEQQHQKNRHNVGFILLDRLGEKKHLHWKNEKKFDAIMAKNNEFLFFKPMTFMNNSGDPVSRVVNFYKIKTDDLLVVHDDVDLHFGDVKKQFASRSAGHKGVQSVIDHLGTKDFWRVRVGVGRPENPEISTEDWVLMDFNDKELEFLDSLDVKV